MLPEESLFRWPLDQVLVEKSGIIVTPTLAIGAYIGTLIAIRLTDTQQRMWFCLIMSTVSGRNLWIARKL